MRGRRDQASAGLADGQSNDGFGPANFCELSVGDDGRAIVEVVQYDGEVALDGCVELVLGPDADRVARGVAFEIESRRGLERTVRLEREEVFPPPGHSPNGRSKSPRHPDRWR